jgi:multidrug resistance efflux pump
MEALLLGIYSFFVWLVFIKLKWLPWNTKSQVVVVIIPIVGLAATILLLNIYAPSSADVRVVKYVVQIVPQVKGRVIEVPVEGNRLYRKGDVLLRVDPTPYELAVEALEAQLVKAEGGTRRQREELKSAAARSAAVAAQLELAERRVAEHQELVEAGAGDRFALEQAEATSRQLQAELAAARASEAQVRASLAAVVGDDQADVAQIRAQLANARWELEQTTMVAPADGYVINLQLRPGAMAVPLPLAPVMSFVEEEFQVIALFHQNELHQVEPGNEAEIALLTNPGSVIKASVNSIVWAQGQGQVAMSGSLPQTGVQPLPPGRFAVKLDVDPRHRDLFFAAGASGDAAIYTNHMVPLHMIRKVILRVGSYTNYIIPKLH